jgi:hypothetical protein
VNFSDREVHERERESGQMAFRTVLSSGVVVR